MRLFIPSRFFFFLKPAYIIPAVLIDCRETGIFAALKDFIYKIILSSG